MVYVYFFHCTNILFCWIVSVERELCLPCFRKMINKAVYLPLTYVLAQLLIFPSGHGGNGFLKFQDSEEITNVELADAFEQMWQKRR